MINKDLRILLHDQRRGLTVRVGGMWDGMTIEHDFGIVVWHSSPSAFRDPEPCSIALVPLNQIEAFLESAAGQAVRVA